MVDIFTGSHLTPPPPEAQLDWSEYIRMTNATDCLSARMVHAPMSHTCRGTKAHKKAPKAADGQALVAHAKEMALI